MDLLLSKNINEDPVKIKQYYYQLGLCAQKLRKDHKALEQYQQAYRLDSTHFPTLKGMSELYLRYERWEEGSNTLQTILIHYKDKLDAQELIEIHYQQGLAKFNLGDLRRALDVLMRASEIDPQHKGVLNLLIETHEKREKWEK